MLGVGGSDSCSSYHLYLWRLGLYVQVMSVMNKELQSYLRDAAFELPLRCIQPLPDQILCVLLCQQEYTSQCMQHAVLYLKLFSLYNA